MRECKKEAVIRFHKYNKDAEPSNWCRSRIMLYFPWRNEQNDLLGGYSSYQEHYEVVKHIVLDNERKYTLADVEGIEINPDNNPEHAWDLLAPSTEANRAQFLAEGDESLTEMSQQDLRDNVEMLASSSRTATIGVRFDSAAKSPVINPKLYRELLRSLNEKQREIVQRCPPCFKAR